MGIGKPAASMFALAGHGGSVALGSPNVMIGGMPAARKGDPITCVLHGSGLITLGSATVFINGMPAARMGDVTGCFLAATALPIAGAAPEVHVGSLDPTDNGKTRAQHDEDGEDTLVHAEYIKTDADGDGKYDTHEVSAQLSRSRSEQKLDVGEMQIITTESIEMGRLDGKYAEPLGPIEKLLHGTPLDVCTGSAEGSAERGTVSIATGKKGSTDIDPDLKITLQGDMLHGKVERESMIGWDNRGRLRWSSQPGQNWVVYFLCHAEEPHRKNRQAGQV